jgi:cytochrome P450
MTTATAGGGAVPPGPVTRIPGKNLLAMSRDPLGFAHTLARTYGDVVRLPFGWKQLLYIVSHPDGVREILVNQQKSFIKGRSLERIRRLLGNGLLTSGGELHLRQRRLAQPAFHRQRIAGYATTMVDHAARVRDRWHDGESVDVSQEMMRFTLAVAAKTLFDADVESEADEIGAALTDAIEALRLVILPYSDLLDRIPLPIARKFRRARARLDATIYRIIDKRRESQTDRGDLLSMLLHARDVEGDGGQMTDEQLRDETVTIFIAGHETSALTLAWAWYQMARHPEVEARLHREVDTVLGDARGGYRLPTADDLPRLEYARRIITETLRLHPPIWALSRRAIVDVEISGYTIPAGSLVFASPFIVHHDARWWPDPERFDPDRWAPEHAETRPKFAYIPFGGGTRLCIGEHFAWMETILALAVLSSRWRLRFATPRTIEIKPTLTLRPKGGVVMIAERRESRSGVSAREVPTMMPNRQDATPSRS